ncbi:MAG: hypothetical protein EZS28_037726 [Streblomastix strix]|uniref:Uncharacterized protein n=1 Tax=Streblomastix strix TaxID=222440 RepID=A0A5J4U893_9EUKA|nr:MAG: hypothetical protein EZS28_037726 [Streblomastix strix]
MAKDSFGEHGIRMEIKLKEIAQNLHQDYTLQQLQRHALSVQLGNPEMWQEKGGLTNRLFFAKARFIYINIKN